MAELGGGGGPAEQFGESVARNVEEPLPVGGRGAKAGEPLFACFGVHLGELAADGRPPLHAASDEQYPGTGGVPQVGEELNQLRVRPPVGVVDDEEDPHSFGAVVRRKAGQSDTGGCIRRGRVARNRVQACAQHPPAHLGALGREVMGQAGLALATRPV